MFADFDGDITNLLNMPAPDEVPVLATRNMVLFPGVLVPILLGRKASLNLAKKLSKSPNDNICAIFCQKNPDVDVPDAHELNEHGVYARLVKIIEMPTHDNVTAIFQALGKCRLESITSIKPFYKGVVSSVYEDFEFDNDPEFKTLLDDLKDTTEELIRSSEDIPDELLLTLKNLTHGTMYVNCLLYTSPSPRDS